MNLIAEVDSRIFDKATQKGKSTLIVSSSSPEISYLLSEVEKHYGRRLSTSSDFEALSVVIEHEIGDTLSASTLKRLWGYVTLNPAPRVSTLDILSRFLGTKDFWSFCEQLRANGECDSTFFTAKCIRSADLNKGDTVTIGWHPNRQVQLRYDGENLFTVVEQRNSKLEVCDQFESTSFLLGYPLCISRIFRGKTVTPSYVAGVKDGLTVLELLKK